MLEQTLGSFTNINVPNNLKTNKCLNLISSCLFNLTNFCDANLIPKLTMPCTWFVVSAICGCSPNTKNSILVKIVEQTKISLPHLKSVAIARAKKLTLKAFSHRLVIA